MLGLEVDEMLYSPSESKYRSERAFSILHDMRTER